MIWNSLGYLITFSFADLFETDIAWCVLSSYIYIYVITLSQISCWRKNNSDVIPPYFLSVLSSSSGMLLHLFFFFLWLLINFFLLLKLKLWFLVCEFLIIQVKLWEEYLGKIDWFSVIWLLIGSFNVPGRLLIMLSCWTKVYLEP